MNGVHGLRKADNSSWIFLATTSNSTGFAFAISLNTKTQLGELCNIIASIFVDKDGTLLNWLGQEWQVQECQL